LHRYDSSQKGFDGRPFCVEPSPSSRITPDIAQGVDTHRAAQGLRHILDAQGAGDQGMMFGFA